MSERFNVFGYVRAVSASGLSPVCRAVLKELAILYANQAGLCWPSQQTLAEGIGYTRKAVNAAMGEAKSGGWIVVEAKKGRSSSCLLVVPDLSPTVTSERHSDVTHGYTTCHPRSQLNGVQMSPTVTPPVTHGYTGVTHGDTILSGTERREPLRRTPAHAPTHAHATREGQGGASGDASFSLSPPSSSSASPNPDLPPPAEAPALSSRERALEAMRAYGITEEFMEQQRAKYRAQKAAYRQEEEQ